MATEPSPAPAAAPKRPAPSRAPSIRYMGFECRDEGRAYHLRVEGLGDPRLVTVTIPTAAFTARKARFQDAPELCYARLQRELEASTDLRDGLELTLTAEEIDTYRDAQLSRSTDRKLRALRSWP